MASEGEREHLFHLLHDLVDEALEQYDAGYAVDLEQRYYDLADTLIAEREQQLAQARALLLRSNDLLQPGFGATDDEREQHAKEIRAFLAQHKEL